MAWRGLDLVFRQKYLFPNRAANWFPGHMTKGLREMQRSLKEADMVIEVHDARVPLSGRNPNFQNLVTGKI